MGRKELQTATIYVVIREMNCMRGQRAESVGAFMSEDAADIAAEVFATHGERDDVSGNPIRFKYPVTYHVSECVLNAMVEC